MDKKNSVLDSKDAEAMTPKDWIKLASRKSGYEKISKKIESFFKLFDTQKLYSNVEEVKDSFAEAFNALAYPKPLKTFEIKINNGLMKISGSVSSPTDDNTIINFSCK